jgi:excisionase family DNA binding protein
MNKVIITQEMAHLFDEYYIKYGTKRFTVLFNEHFGERKSINQINRMANKLGLTGKYAPPGYYTIAEVSELLDVTRKHIEYWIDNDRIKCKQYGGCRRFIPQEEFDRLVEHYSIKSVPPWPAMTIEQAANYIGVYQRTILHNIHYGSIIAVKIKETPTSRAMWYVKKDQILWGRNYAKKTGVVFIPWKKYPYR